MRFRIQYLITIRCLASVFLAVLACTSASAKEKSYPGPFVENDQLLVILIPHTPEQMAAFYEARGFPRDAIIRIRKTCFVTVHIENKSRSTIWLEQKNWRTTSNNKPLPRLGSDYWNGQWNEINLRLASRSTFGWTQLPAVRDLQPDESVGGNIAFPGTTGSFDLEANFYVGQDKRGGMLVTRFENVQCPKDEPGS
ncbi:MAG: hypothetical protein KAJ06_10835 [Gammaproteobacteria bacterium]|nr:hypothetical protein [Gammaproteobacteria bacterium]